MNCRECIEELSTTSLREMRAESAVMEHCATCPDCAQLTTSLRQREYEAATVLNNLPPLSSPITVAEASATLARRRAVGRVVVMTSGVIGAIIIGVVSSTMVIPALVRSGMLPGAPSRAGLRTETFALTCLSPEQAADIINPYVRSNHSVYYTMRSGIPAITVRGTVDELARSRMLIRDFESNPAAACHHNLGEALKSLQKELKSSGSIGADVKPELAGPDAASRPHRQP